MKFSENLNLPILQDGDKYSKEIQNEAFKTIDKECTNIKNTIKSALDISEDVSNAIKTIGDISEELSDLKEKQNEDYYELLESNNYIGDKIRDINSQLEQKANDAIIIKQGVRNYNIQYKDIDFNKCITANNDGVTLDNWSVDNNILSPINLGVNSYYILDKKLIDGKISFKFTNSNFNTANNDSLGICFMGSSTKDHIRVSFYAGPNKNKVTVNKIVDGNTEVLGTSVLTLDNLQFENELYNNVTIELIGCNFTVSVNGEKIVTRNNVSDLNYLKEHSGFVAFYCNSINSTSSNFKIKNISIEEYDYRQIPFKVNEIDLIGDSIMHGSGASTLSVSWGGLFAKFLNDNNIKCSNYAVGGNNLNSIYYQLKNNILTKEVKPQIVICSGGTNDCRIDHAHLDIDVSFENLSRIVKLCKVNNITPVVCTIIPFSKGIDKVTMNKTSYIQMLAFNERIQEFAKREKIRLIDNYYNFNMDNMTDDNIHPNDEGHKVLYENSIKALFFSL